MTWLAVAGGIALALSFGVRWLRNHLPDSETEHDNWDTSVDLGSAEDLEADLAADEAAHVKAIGPSVEFVPDGFTCLDCGENPALPFTVWCSICNRAAWGAIVAPSSPLDGGKR